MNVLRFPVHATRTLIALTLTVLIAVLVNKDSMEMECLVKVHACENGIKHYQFETRNLPS